MLSNDMRRASGSSIEGIEICYRYYRTTRAQEDEVNVGGKEEEAPRVYASASDLAFFSFFSFISFFSFLGVYRQRLSAMSLLKPSRKRLTSAASVATMDTSPSASLDFFFFCSRTNLHQVVSPPARSHASPSSRRPQQPFPA